MTKSYRAIITVLDEIPGDAHPEHPIVIPPEIEHPIVIPEPPGGGPPVVIWPGRPTHPIVLPPDGKPPSDKPPPRPDHTLPGDLPHPAHPIVIPLPPIEPPLTDAHPEHPIVLPPPGFEPPDGTWGPGDGFPTPPIVIPPEEKPDRPKLIEWGVVWTPNNGWQVIGVPTVPHPAPSSKRR